MKQFLQRVWGDGKGWVFVGYKNHATGDWEQKNYQYPDQLDTIIKESKEKNTIYSSYFCPHLFKAKGRRVKDNSLPTLVLWVDKDAGALTDFTPRPTFCWQTSEGKWQALWLLDTELDIEKAEVINKKLIGMCKGDKGGWHAGKYLRMPETINHKYKPAYHGMVLWDDGPQYKAEQFVTIEAPKDEFQEAIQDIMDIPDLPKKIPSFSDAIVAHGRHIPKVAWELLQQEPKKGEDWSDKIWRLESLLIKADIPIEHVFAIVKGSPWNKYERDGRPDEHLWKEIYKAYKEKAVIVPEDELEDLPWMGLDSLLLYAERPQWLVDNIWMAKNVGWIAGEGKSYKSIMSLDLALSVASGTPFLGKFKVNDPGTVLMVQEEDPVWRVAHRIQAMAEAKGITNFDVAHKEGSLVLRMNETNVPLFLSIGGKLTFEDEGRMSALERAIATRRPKLVVLDPMFMLSAGMDEFKAGEMAHILNTLKQWRNEYECAIAIVHHYRKGQGADTQKLYGSMALYAWSENSLLVQRESRDTNLVSIRRDIKDAPSDDKLAVEFINIDEEYRYVLRDLSSTGNPTIANALRGHALEDAITIKGLQDITGLSDRAVRQHVKEMEEGGLVKTDRVGRGGVLHITPTARLLDAPQEEVIFG
jgi:DNA-binding transcriptional ArsR family regulator